MKIKISLVLLVAGLMITGITFGQDPPPPPPPGHGAGGNVPGGGAPIGGGLLILVALGAAYGGKKVWDLKRENLII